MKSLGPVRKAKLAYAAQSKKYGASVTLAATHKKTWEGKKVLHAGAKAKSMDLYKIAVAAHNAYIAHVKAGMTSGYMM